MKQLFIIYILISSCVLFAFVIPRNFEEKIFDKKRNGGMYGISYSPEPDTQSQINHDPRNH